MWIYAINGKNVGPVSFEEIVNQINQGVIVADTVVCELGQTPCRAGEHPKVSSYFPVMGTSQTSGLDFTTTDVTQQKSISKKTTNVDKSITPKGSQKSSDSLTEHKVIKSPILFIIVGLSALFVIAGAIGGWYFYMQNSAKKMYVQAEKYFNNENYVKAVELYKKAAKYGNTDAQNKLGTCYESGKGVEQNYAEALKWYRKSAKKGNSDAEFSMGWVYYFGHGVEQDPVEAVKWLRKSAEKENTSALSMLATCYITGVGVEKDYNEAVKWLRKSAEKGEVNAQCMLGTCYFTGEGIEKNYDEAVKWLSKSAEKGNGRAQYLLGLSYYSGDGVKKDYAEAAQWFEKSAVQGNADAQLKLGLLYLVGDGVKKNYAEAAQWFEKSAEQGNAQAQFNLGSLYFSGDGVDIDYEEGINWLRKSAEQGDINAQYCLGKAYIMGEGVEVDYAQAVKWLRKSAEQGDAQAQYWLGIGYSSGDGVEKNMGEAAKWFRKSAEQGNADAQYLLGMQYSSGDGVIKDYTEAAKWFRKSAEQGNDKAQYGLGACYAAGFGVEKNYAEAIKWYRKSVEQGNNDEAQLELGKHYFLGNGVPQNTYEAVKWFRKSAEQENQVAQYFLGLSYIEGNGVRVDRQEGLRWIERAADQGNEEAIKFLEKESQKEKNKGYSLADTKTEKDDDEFIPQRANANGSLITILPEKRGNTVKEDSETVKQEPVDTNRFVQVINGVPFVFRWCPAGEFTMGSPEDEEDRDGIEKQHKVKFTKGFWILETEVTYAQWYAVMGQSLTDTNSRGSSFNSKGNYPVENVSWNDCVVFCQRCNEKRLKVKLPTEAQWEYACRAGTTGPFAGEFEDLTCYVDNSGQHSCPVKQYDSNKWKIYGMHGNVAEWCADWGGPYKLEDQTNPIGPGKGTKRITRGGSWGSSRSFCRSAFRGSLEPDKKTPGLGFRLILLGHDKEE